MREDCQDTRRNRVLSSPPLVSWPIRCIHKLRRLRGGKLRRDVPAPWGPAVRVPVGRRMLAVARSEDCLTAGPSCQAEGELTDSKGSLVTHVLLMVPKRSDRGHVEKVCNAAKHALPLLDEHSVPRNNHHDPTVALPEHNNSNAPHVFSESPRCKLQSFFTVFNHCICSQRGEKVAPGSLSPRPPGYSRNRTLAPSPAELSLSRLVIRPSRATAGDLVRASAGKKGGTVDSSPTKEMRPDVMSTYDSVRELTVPDETSLNCMRSFTRELRQILSRPEDPKSRNSAKSYASLIKNRTVGGRLTIVSPRNVKHILAHADFVARLHKPVSKEPRLKLKLKGTAPKRDVHRVLALHAKYTTTATTSHKDLRLPPRNEARGCMTARGSDIKGEEQAGNGGRLLDWTDFGRLGRGMHIEVGETVLLFPMLATPRDWQPQMAVPDVLFVEPNLVL